MREETMKKIDEFGDKEEHIFSAERCLLRNVFDASRDLVQGFHDDDFADANGGINKLVREHEIAVDELQEWIDEGWNPD